MNKILHKIGYVVTALLITCVIKAQTVVYDGNTPNRPTAINGLIVNGTAYNVNIVYGAFNTSSNLSGIGAVDAEAAAIAIRDVLNMQSIDSRTTTINIIIAAVGISSHSRISILDSTFGINDWTSTSINTASNVLGNATIGVTNFTVTSLPSATQTSIPTMSQWGLLIFGLLIINLGVFFIHQRNAI